MDETPIWRHVTTEVQPLEALEELIAGCFTTRRPTALPDRPKFNMAGSALLWEPAGTILDIMSSMKTLSEQLREAIVSSGVSRYTISKQTGVSQAALSKFVLGHRGISMKAMDAVGVFLGLSITRKRAR